MSRIEARFQGYKYDKHYPLTFNDKDGDSFKAKSDIIFKDTYTGEIWLGELKEHELNSIKTLKTSTNNLVNQMIWRGMHPSDDEDHNSASAALWRGGDRVFCLNNGWNHSKFKQGIVSQALLESGINFVVIFDNHHPMIGSGRQQKHFKLHYQQKSGIRHVMLESEFLELQSVDRYRPLTPDEIVEFELQLLQKVEGFDRQKR